MSTINPRRVVITGATGNVGTSLVRVLSESEEIGSVVGLARRTPAWTPAKTEWVRADVADETEDLVRTFTGADAVVHLAWRFQPTRDPVATWRANVLGSLSVFDAVATAGVPVLIHASSVGAYSPGPKGQAVDESWPTHGWPTASYCREKAYLERVLDAFEPARPQIRVVRMRPAFLFKEEAASEQRRIFGGRFLPGQLIRPELLRLLPSVPGLRFQALHTDDAARAFQLALTTDVRGAFNLAAEPPIDADLLGELLGAKLVPVPGSVVRSTLSAAWHLHLAGASPQLLDAVLRLPLLDCSRARRDLGWETEHSAADALKEVLSGMRSGKGMDTPPLVGHKAH
jgi:nucleoside-diphosphate-sugar epimerase